MVYPKEVLNRLKWDSAKDLDEATIWYVHRGAPGDVLSIRGSEIVSLDKGFFETVDASIPYHRVTLIEYHGEVVFDKKRERGH
ncbi:MAG: DUF504 domain-containing protein [Methanobacteriota archaeon]|nr:MAG: DUF504 domain-containing protein [Euryarchaeota archaeon]